MDVQIPCPCPEKDGEPRHEHDTVTLRDVLDFTQATTITKAIALIDNDDDRTRPAEVLATLTEYYVLIGVERWTLRDGSNKPVPVTKGAIRSTILDRQVMPVIEAAEGLYQEAILIPLLARASNFSQPSQTEPSTSPKQAGSPPKSRKPSKRSSITTIQTGDTETTSGSLAGDSSFSQSSESAA